MSRIHHVREMVVVVLLGLPFFSGCVHRLAKGDLSAGERQGYFRDVSVEAGLTFRYDNDTSPQKRFIETTGGGCAFLDYDNDGYLDIFAVQGGPAPGSPPRPRPMHALYHNVKGARFEEATAKAGLAVDVGYGQGVAAADYDNDGWCDLLVTAYGGATLFRNEQGHFDNVTRQAGLSQEGQPHWNTSAAWADYDRDGHLDLFICHYAYWFADNERPCYDPDGKPMYCPPTNYVSDTSLLYRNRGDGTFEEVSARVGLGQLKGKALGAAWLDYDNDGWPDLCVSHDMASNWLLHNKRNGRFEEVGAQAGVALGNMGRPLSGMGVAVGDFNGDLWDDLFIVNFSLQPRTYLLNTRNGVFDWSGHWAGLGGDSQPFLAFGVEALDYDGDGDLDLILGNGHINEAVDSMEGGVSYRQRQQLLRNLGDGRFHDDIKAAGDLEHARLTRGLAVGDYDNDGHPDCLASGPGEPLALFRNIGTGSHWIGVRLEGKRSNRDGIGAKVRLAAGGSSQARTVRSGSSYLSRSDSRLLFGIGTSGKADRMEITWPSGKRQSVKNLQADCYYLIQEQGRCQPDPRLARQNRNFP